MLFDRYIYSGRRSIFSKSATILALATTLLAAGPAGAQDLASAKIFVHSLFAPDGKTVAYNPSNDPMAEMRKLATPALAALSEAVDAHELDFDPMCLCQESSALTVVGVSARSDGPERAQVSIALLSDRVYARRIQLVAMGGRWRIDNITAGEENLRAILADKIEAREASTAAR